MFRGNYKAHRPREMSNVCVQVGGGGACMSMRCVCVCVYIRQTEREIERGGGKQILLKANQHINYKRYEKNLVPT